MAPKENETTEEHVKKCLARSNADSVFRRWVSVGNGELGIRMNWVTSILAVIITWGFAVICLVDKVCSDPRRTNPPADKPAITRATAHEPHLARARARLFTAPSITHSPATM